MKKNLPPSMKLSAFVLLFLATTMVVAQFKRFENVFFNIYRCISLENQKEPAETRLSG